MLISINIFAATARRAQLSLYALIFFSLSGLFKRAPSSEVLSIASSEGVPCRFSYQAIRIKGERSKEHA